MYIWLNSVILLGTGVPLPHTLDLKKGKLTAQPEDVCLPSQRMLWQEDCEFEAGLGYTVGNERASKLCLKKNKMEGAEKEKEMREKFENNSIVSP